MPGASASSTLEDGLMRRMCIRKLCARISQPWAAL